MSPDLAHQPAIALILVVVSVAGACAAVVNLRNTGLWLLQLRGRRATGVVTTIEITTGRGNEMICRPVVAFTTDQGAPVEGRPSLFRRSTSLTKGATVQVRYATRNPARIIVPGFGFRVREPVYACLGGAVTIAVAALYFKI